MNEILQEFKVKAIDFNFFLEASRYFLLFQNLHLHTRQFIKQLYLTFSYFYEIFIIYFPAS
jgi:hypothetical protein